MKEQALFINFHPYGFFTRRGRSVLPTEEVGIHLVTRNRAFGGVTGVEPKDFSRVTVVDARYEDQWRAACDWALDTYPISRVMAIHERAVLFAAELRSRYGLDGIDVETANRFRDKVAMKRAVVAAGAAQVPDFAPLDSLEDLVAIDWTVGKWVVKSRWGLGASEVHVVDSWEAARQVCLKLDLGGSQYEIERFVEGEIYHCDAIVQDGEVSFVNVGRYTANPAAYGPGTTFGTVTILEGDLYRRILGLNARVLSALGLQEGVTHLELFHTPDDELVFCEVAGRPPGGIIPPVIEWQFGVSMVEASLRQQAGLAPVLPTPRAGNGAGVCGFVAFYPGDGPERGIPPELQTALGVLEHLHNGSAGDGHGGVRHSTDFLDSYVVRAPDESTLRRRLQDIRFEYDKGTR
ncbi:ATP-grasp domain-containing protein [Streptomyces sp. NPDC012510]|uniref:ATP-grasp domain-containing protein n=1 Tax=Streptomyces sp. NPDC012510 TaxID=3364838 RepID=UPI0036E4C59D